MLGLLVGVLLMASAAPPAAAAAPTLVVTSPADNAVIGNGTPAVVTFRVTDFVLVQPGQVGQIVSPTEGHVDVYLDGVYARLITRVEPISLTLTSGPHVIRLQLVQSDGAALIPDVSAIVHVVATQGPASGTPSIQIVSPRPGEATGHDVYVFVAVSNFTLVEALGQPNAPNEGHIQLFRGGVFQQDLGPYGSGFLVDLPDGNSTITARLVNNDYSPLSPDVSAGVTIRVKQTPDPGPSEEITGGLSLILASILAVLLYRRRVAARQIRRDLGPPP